MAAVSVKRSIVFLFHSWFATTSLGGHVGGQYNKNSFYKLLEKCRKVDKLDTGDFNLKVTLFSEEYDTTMIKCLCVCFIQ